jgi:phospholipid/cholesterol/gamma-HCH transport system substrate-binding protein
MKRSVVETVLGAIVLVVAIGFLVFSYSTANVGEVSGYQVKANFSGIGGLKVGDEVQISGVKVGQVAKVELDPQTYLARVTMEVEPSVKLPEDTAAMISSQSLLGGKYMSLEPGGAEEPIPPGGEIQYTQAPQNLEQLLGQFIFSMKDGKKGETDEPAAAMPDMSSPAPVPAEEPLPESAPALDESGVPVEEQ